MKKYRCTRNAKYLDNCHGSNDVSARQGYYIMADNKEEAWQKMAIMFPEETEIGFTVDEQ